MIKRLFTIFLLLFYSNIMYADDRDILEKVESSARSWLGLVDSGHYKESLENSSPLLRAKTSETEWIKLMTAIRSPRGAMSSRFIATAGATNSLFGFPEGNYVILQFYTTFTEKGLVLEIVTLAKDQDEKWQISEYAIK